MTISAGFPKRRAVIFSIVFLIALAHIFRIGSYLQGAAYDFYYSYFSDIALPFGYYFILCAADRQIPLLRPWGVKLGITFLIPSIAETAQFFGMPVLGSTFDLLDYFAYAAGALSAAALETQVFSRIINPWTEEKAGR